jgi:hypothetical protein
VGGALERLGLKDFFELTKACCYSCAEAHRSEAGPQSIRPGRKASFMTSRHQDCYFSRPISSAFFEPRVSISNEARMDDRAVHQDVAAPLFKMKRAG